MFTKFGTSLLGRCFLIAVLVVMELGVMPAERASASSLTVINTNDSGPGSLRQAIADAGTDDVITFDPSLAGATITLASDIFVTFDGVNEKRFTIDGSGLSPQVTISGGDVAHLEFSSYTDVTLTDLTITHGYGSGIKSLGKLTILNSTLRDNDSGGAVNSSGQLTLKNSTVTQNQSIDGGGISIGGAGANQIINSTITQNSASNDGGGISLRGSAVVEIYNSTFAGNSAPQGAEIDQTGTSGLYATNTIFACAPENTNCYQYFNIGLTNSTLGVGTLYDYGLAALADNGGPTQTMALLPGSPLIDAGNDASCETTDQRGGARPKGSHCDIGAYEYEDLTPPTVLSIVRADPNPTSASTVSFTVTFSESVINVGTDDFSPATTGVNGAVIANVSGSGASYTVTVDTGSGSGTIRLDLVDDDSIKDLANLPLGGAGTGNGNYTGGETYDIVWITIAGSAGVAGVTLDYTDGSQKTATADGSGNYSFTVSYNWMGTVTPSKAGYTFSPASSSYANITEDQLNQNYTATPIIYTISGDAGVAGAVLSYTDGSSMTATADGNGNYSFSVSYGWSGTVTPSKTGYTFLPARKIYTNVLADQAAQDYSATPITFTISGNAGVAGATLNYTDGSPKTATADGSGNYSFTVSYNWSGTVTPAKDGFTFNPVGRTYSNVLSDKTGQNYAIPAPSASFDAWPTTINVQSSTKFHIVSTLNTTSCTWDYGDGNQVVSPCESYHDYFYSEPGFYTVTLTVTGPGGADSVTLTRYITVYPTLVVSKTGNGTGTIMSNPVGINCGSSCSGDLNYQAVITLTAAPAPGSTFVGWNGGGCSGTDSCTINVQTATTVTAHFEKIVANCPSITKWKGEYWVNSSLSGTPVLCRNDASLDFDWGYGSPDPTILPDNFSAQWTRTVNLSGGSYLFHIDHDDGARLYVDNMVTPVMDKWGTCCVVDTSAPVTLSVGNHVIRLEYYEGGGAANAHLWWEKVSPDVTSITRADPDPTSASSVHFNVTFSENVTNVDASDFSLTTTGITGASISGVAGSGAARIVTVKTGSGNGTLRLDVADNDSILNGSGFPLGGAGSGNGDFTSGETYTVRKNPTFIDVPTSHPYYQDIEILYANGLTGGCSTGPLKFCPERTMNRGEAAVFMLRANFGSSYVPPVPTHIFQDDWSKGTWAEPWAEGMLKKGLSGGCQASPPKYCPWDLMPREQAVIFALRMKYGTSYTPPSATGTVFADMTNPSYYATSWAERAYKDGLIPNCGMSGGKPKICPKDLVSRGLAAYMIVRAKNLSMP